MTTPIETTDADYVAPQHYRCHAAECNDILVGYVLHPESDASSTAVCANHLPEGQDFVFAKIGERYPSYNPSERVHIGYSGSTAAQQIREFLKQYRLVMIYNLKEMSAAFDKHFRAVQDLDFFKDKVVEEVVGWSAGCREGKTEFLEALGLDWPSVEVTVTCTFSYKGDVDDLSSSEFEYALTSALAGDFENVYTEVDY